MTAGWTIGKLAKTVGVNIQTVRYYERLNLLSPSGWVNLPSYSPKNPSITRFLTSFF